VGLSASLSGRPGATVPGMVNLGTVPGDPDEITVSTTDPDKVTVWLGAAGETDLTRREAEEFAAPAPSGGAGDRRLTTSLS
jgi:hypothetical protein